VQLVPLDKPVSGIVAAGVGPGPQLGQVTPLNQQIRQPVAGVVVAGVVNPATDCVASSTSDGREMRITMAALCPLSHDRANLGRHGTGG
jgi:hypothetical protein